MFNIIITFLNIVVLIVLIYFLLKQRKNLIALEEKNISIIENNSEFKEILLIGLYNRFKKDNEKILESEFEEIDSVQSDEKAWSELFILKTPVDFEKFVAKIIEDYYGGNTYVLGKSSDFGVGFEHDMDKGRLIGRVICNKTDVTFDTVALIHSNMVKDDLIGGYVITTSDFTPDAYEYSKDLNIELINGEKIVDYWLAGLHKKNIDSQDGEGSSNK